jgi:hypothetical protein
MNYYPRLNLRPRQWGCHRLKVKAPLHERLLQR